jgi:hypothetical protein
MVKMTRFVIVLFALAALIGKADTVTTRDSSSWNGNVTITNDVLKLVATFRSGPITLQFGANYVREIDFNTARYNPGSNPANLLPKPNGGVFSGTVYTANRTSQKCGNITVEPGRVWCDGKLVPGVIRISVANTR